MRDAQDKPAIMRGPELTKYQWKSESHLLLICGQDTAAAVSPHLSYYMSICPYGHVFGLTVNHSPSWWSLDGFQILLVMLWMMITKWEQRILFTGSHWNGRVVLNWCNLNKVAKARESRTSQVPLCKSKIRSLETNQIFTPCWLFWSDYLSEGHRFKPHHHRAETELTLNWILASEM